MDELKTPGIIREAMYELIHVLANLTLVLVVGLCMWQGKWDQASATLLVLVYLRIVRIQEKVEALKL